MAPGQDPTVKLQQLFDERRAPTTPRPGRRIGGLLIIVAVGLVLNLIQNLFYFLAALAFVVRQEKWELLTNPASTSYHPYWKSILILDLISSSVILILTLLTSIAFFRKSRIFPALAIATMITILSLTLVGHYYLGLIPAIASTAAYAKEGEQMIIRFLAMGIWLPYFLFSKRVKETFGRG